MEPLRPPNSAAKRRLQWIWPALIAGLIIGASSRSTVAGPHLPHFDKVVHFHVYGLLATLICRLSRGWRGAAWAIFICSAFGVSDEWHQSFVPGRSTELADWMADTLGAALAVGLYVGWTRYRNLLERPLWSRTRNSEA